MSGAVERFTILHLDETLVAIDKPPGYLVHKSSMALDVSTVVLQQLRDQIGRWLYPVHRLDRPTSGVLVFALTPEAAKAMVACFERRAAKKTYLAAVRGYLPGSGTIDMPLLDRGEDEIGRVGPEQEAITDYRTLTRAGLDWPIGAYPRSRFSLALLQPRTGRRHQLRRHLKHASRPIIGDRMHGDRAYNQAVLEATGSDRLCLHALSLQLPHPTSGEPLTLSAPPDAELHRVFRQLCLEVPAG